MTEKPVSHERIVIASDYGLHNVAIIAEVCREVGIPFYAACALFEQESMGRNVYGHDRGGALAGFEKPVSKGNFEVFYWLVVQQGHTSNGVGPSQITYAGDLRHDGTRDGGFFRRMAEQGLKPWVVRDNMQFGLTLLRDYHDRTDSWERAGLAYNGSEEYGEELAEKVRLWRQRLGER